MRCINNSISEKDIDNLWGKVVSFEVKEADPCKIIICSVFFHLKFFVIKKWMLT